MDFQIEDRTSYAQGLARDLNNRVPTLKCANGATTTEDGAALVVPIELAERVLRVLAGDESAACRRVAGVQP